MKLSIRLIVAIAILPVAMLEQGCKTTSASNAAPNQLSAREAKAGWKLLFDGKTLSGWRTYRKPGPPDHGWEIKDGVLTCVAGAHGGDMITEQKFTDFDLQWDWKVPAGANNGIKYLVTEDRPSAPGHEYQMIDDAIVADKPKEMTASFYDVLPPAADKRLKPVGEWNHSRVLLQGNHVEHWLNGKLVLTYELGSPELREAIAKSKFKNSRGFADKITGPILLTEHHDEASYRNIKILELPAK